MSSLDESWLLSPLHTSEEKIQNWGHSANGRKWTEEVTSEVLHILYSWILGCRYRQDAGRTFARFDNSPDIAGTSPKQTDCQLVFAYFLKRSNSKWDLLVLAVWNLVLHFALLPCMERTSMALLNVLLLVATVDAWLWSLGRKLLGRCDQSRF